MYVRVHAANGRASCAPPFGLFLRTLAAPQGAPFGRHPAAEATAPTFWLFRSVSQKANDRIDAGTDSCTNHRVRRLAFLVTFWALRRRSGANSEAGRVAAEGRMPGVVPKSNRLAVGETKLPGCGYFSI